MKIAIYGDSFGYEDLLFNEFHPNVDKIGKSWVGYLREYYSIDNFCKPASDLYYSYIQFLKNYKKYDKNIFLITSPGRLSFKYKGEYVHGHSVFSVLGKYQLEKDKEKQKTLNAAVEYFKYLQDYEKDQEMNRLMLNEIKQLDKNLLTVDCFDNGLVNITKLEDTEWKLKLSYSALDDCLDLRFSHMTKENNLILTNEIKKCIENNKSFKFDIDRFVRPKFEEKSLYIVKKLR